MNCRGGEAFLRLLDSLSRAMAHYFNISAKYLTLDCLFRLGRWVCAFKNRSTGSAASEGKSNKYVYIHFIKFVRRDAINTIFLERPALKARRDQ